MKCEESEERFFSGGRGDSCQGEGGRDSSKGIGGDSFQGMGRDSSQAMGRDSSQGVGEILARGEVGKILSNGERFFSGGRGGSC